MRFLFSSKKVISNGISSVAPYLPSQEILTVVGTFSKFVVAYADMPDDTAITIQYEKNYATEFKDTTEVDDDERKFVYAEEGVSATTLRLKILPTVDGNDAPTIESAGVFLS